ncbi:unnamed protein product [Paramecium octaurelia]|uniref:Uncharacterized protein n=1 Tax=Paramecium octaurelia TaxID=43137 RepID=A0A8S1TWR9_PAROT|nr:unnamed protein product [Paramecium octaurelia]
MIKRQPPFPSPFQFQNDKTSRNDTSKQNFYLNVTARNSSISIKTDASVQIKIVDQDKQNLQNVVNKQKQRDSQVSFASQCNSNIINNQMKQSEVDSKLSKYFNSINQNQYYNDINNKINNSDLHISRTQSKVSLTNNQELKQSTIKGCNTLTTILKPKDIEDRQKNLTESNYAEAYYKQQLTDRDIQLKKIKEELSKCQNELQMEKENSKRIEKQLVQQRKESFSQCQIDLQIERQQIIRMKEQLSKLDGILNQKQIEIDQLQSKNHTFLQVIRNIEEIISLAYQKEVKIMVKQI